MVSRSESLRVQTASSKYQYFLMDELEQIKAAIEMKKISSKRTINYVKRYELLIKVLLYTGARIDEVLPARDREYKRKVKLKKGVRTRTVNALNTAGIRPKDFDFESNVIHMLTLKQKEEDDSMRTIPLRPELKDAIQGYMLDYGIAKDSDMPFFPMRRQTAEDWFKDLGNEIGLHIHPHKFRHTFGHIAARSGIYPGTLKTWLGHSNISNTMKYYQVSGEETKADMARMKFSNVTESNQYNQMM